MENRNDKIIFWGCFLALVTTAFGFISRIFLIGTWETEFGLGEAEKGLLLGVGIWPFAVSIIGFSLFIDRIGYKTSMFFAFAGHITWAIMGYYAYTVRVSDPELAKSLLYWGSLILALGNGTVEAFINPVVATMFNKEKTKWLNILHAGWPGGLVITGMIVIFMGEAPWGLKVGIIAIPAVIYFLMLVPRKFPVSERVASNVSYREMLSEFGILGAAIVGFLVTLQLMYFFSGVESLCVDVNGNSVLAPWAKGIFIGIGAAIVVAFGLYTRAWGRPLMLVLILIMMPLATTEIGTDAWITDIMKGVFAIHPGWILIYTSAIMMVLRFCAGPIVHAFSPLGLLSVSALLAIAGLYTLSLTTGLAIFAAATLYGVGKTFFWPTMLGVVSEQCPKGGAFTLNAIGGIGMLTVGTLGTPYIGILVADKKIDAMVESADLNESLPDLTEDGTLTVLNTKKLYETIPYDEVDEEKLDALVAALPEDDQKGVKEQINTLATNSSQGALASMTVFPIIMLIGYLLLIFYFKSKGGYKAEELTTHAAEEG